MPCNGGHRKGYGKQVAGFQAQRTQIATAQNTLWHPAQHRPPPTPRWINSGAMYRIVGGRVAPSCRDFSIKPELGPHGMDITIRDGSRRPFFPFNAFDFFFLFKCKPDHTRTFSRSHWTRSNQCSVWNSYHMFEIFRTLKYDVFARFAATSFFLYVYVHIYKMRQTRVVPIKFARDLFFSNRGARNIYQYSCLTCNLGYTH